MLDFWFLTIILKLDFDIVFLYNNEERNYSEELKISQEELIEECLLFCTVDQLFDLYSDISTTFYSK